MAFAGIILNKRSVADTQRSDGRSVNGAAVAALGAVVVKRSAVDGDVRAVDGLDGTAAAGRRIS